MFIFPPSFYFFQHSFNYNRKCVIIRTMQVRIDEQKIDELLTRGVDKIYPSKEALLVALRSGKKLVLYQGFDPTGDKLHIGHMVGLRKLAQWQKLGHHVIFLIGDGTGQAGDPSGKTKKREKFFTKEELRQNANDYIKQASKIVDFKGDNPIEVLYNSDWLNKLTLVDVLGILDNFSHSQLAERNLFKEREKKGEEVVMREFMYPVLQAYDSVAMKVDLEIGGSDQTFNMLCGRDLVKKIQHREKFVLTTPLLTDSQGKKIGKTEGNVIALTDAPEDLFGKIMSLPDDVISNALRYLTDMPMAEIEKIEKNIEKGENPMIFKKRLAVEIISQLYDKDKAEMAEKRFNSTFQKKEIPNVVEEIEIKGKPISTLVASGIAPSSSVAGRLFEAGAVTDMTENKKITSKDKLKSGHVYKIGKHRFIKIK